jgi:cytochrome o ubiquinol oxidase subunit III
MSAPALRLAHGPELGPAGIAPGEVSGHGAGGPAPKRIIVGYGFWIFLLSDVIMFSAFFAAYAVLFKSTAGGPSAHELFDVRNTAAETALLLASTFTCGMASLAVGQRSQKWTQVALLVTGLLGFAFIILEIREFSGFVARGAGPGRSAFLSSFFTLVGCHDDGAVLRQGIPPGHSLPLPLLQSVLARAGHHLGRYLQPGLPGGCASTRAAAMSEPSDYEAGSYVGADRPPGRPEERTVAREVRGHLLGLGLAALLTIASFWADQTREIYASGIAMALLVLAVAQIGIHLIFFLHITTDPDNENNVLALAFGVLVVCLIVFGSLWVMLHLNHNLMPMDRLMQLQR